MNEKNLTKTIKSVIFDPTILRTCRSGDNWCMTWADDNNLYTSCDDGWGWDYTSCPKGPWIRSSYNNRVWRIRGGPYDLNPEFLPNYPNYWMRDEWYGYGIISVDSVLYHFITCASDDGFNDPFRGAKLLFSPDHGDCWYLHDGTPIYRQERRKSGNGMFFWEEGDDFAFSVIEFAQCGKDHTLARDGYVYLFSPNGRYRNHQLNLARVPADKILDRSAYEFFESAQGKGVSWTKEIGRRGTVHEFPGNYGWYSWLPSVVYNKGLGLYIMAAGGTGVNGSGMHELPASLGIYCAEQPWGPYCEIYYTDNWIGDNPQNRLYQPKLSPKWISEDGREMFLIFSDASFEWGYQYRWNQQKITFVL